MWFKTVFIWGLRRLPLTSLFATADMFRGEDRKRENKDWETPLNAGPFLPLSEPGPPCITNSMCPRLWLILIFDYSIDSAKIQ
jgi:hypothetical protein